MDSLANCTQLQIFSIASNFLEGHVPASLGILSSQLDTLYLSENKLSGSFPSGIENLTNLTRLSLYNNRFTGEIPEWLGCLKKLQTIWLYQNNFTGFLPTSLSNLSQLGQLLLRSNKFGGLIPPGLGNLQMLQHLDISNNSLHGTVPKEIFGIPTIFLIDLSFNNLDGRLPTEIGNAKQLSYLSLSTNKLSGDIPNTLGNCETSLGNLKYLEQLDLSFNHLEGEVPTEGIFKNATAVRIHGDRRLCGGVLELHLPACPDMPSNSDPLVIIVLIAMVILVLLFWRGKHKRKSLVLPSFGRQFPKVSFSDIARATQGFATANIIGRGRYGSVYQGKLFQDGSDVAIKVFNLETRGSQKSFISECNALRNVRHRNLVPILTTCSSIDSNGNDFKALVYEMCNGRSCIDYSFGIVLLEIFLRKRPTDDMFKDGLDIVKFVEVNYPCGISQIVDLDLLQDEVEFPQGSRSAMKAKDLNCLISVLNIGLCCTKVSPNERLDMHEVAARLHGIKEAYLREN
ncbi:hypothetical protein VPH35_107484 [Triticum aestivum]